MHHATELGISHRLWEQSYLPQFILWSGNLPLMQKFPSIMPHSIANVESVHGLQRRRLNSLLPYPFPSLSRGDVVAVRICSPSGLH